jgi:hypothetical protein
VAAAGGPMRCHSNSRWLGAWTHHLKQMGKENPKNIRNRPASMKFFRGSFEEYVQILTFSDKFGRDQRDPIQPLFLYLNCSESDVPIFLLIVLVIVTLYHALPRLVNVLW